MDLEDLDLFVRAVQEGSMSRAARSLGMAQPTVSRRIQRLEAELGQAVLDRTGRALSPTRAGLAVLRFAESVASQRAELSRHLQTPPDLTGELTVAASTTPGESFVPALVAEFARLHPRLVTHVHVMDSLAAESCVAQRVCDAGFVGHEPRPGMVSWHVVEHDELLLAVGSAHPRFLSARLPLGELLEQAFVERPPGSGTRRTVEERMAAAGVVAYASRHIVTEVSSAHAVLAAVARGSAVGFVSERLLRGADRAVVRGLRVEGVRLDRSLYFIHRERALGTAAGAFREFVLTRR